tara:strand:+ start:1200 stop:1412 length:213 start_codon:yes stop_codon:yes gene_type:complete
MDKQKILVKSLIWLSLFSLSVLISAICLFVGFNHERNDSYIVLSIGFICLPLVFFFAYKAFKLISQFIFD